MSITHPILASAARLPNQELLARVQALAGKEREASAELVAHLAELDTRRAIYAAEGYGSLFSYCTRALRLSEDAACNRIEAARACRRFPVILDLLASGAVTLTAIRILGRHLTPENHETVLAQAKGRTRADIEELVARLAPRPDLPSLVRPVPAPVAPASPVGLPAVTLPVQQPISPAPAEPATATTAQPLPPAPRPSVRPSAPERYHVQFTIGRETREKLQRLQDLLAREIPGGDPAVIFDRAITALLEKVERQKLAATTRPRRIRPGTDKRKVDDEPSRHIPAAVRRAVWRRDGGQCAFVASNGRRCTERRYLECHHVHPHAYKGPPTVDNIALRCRLHNQHEAEVIFGPFTLPRRSSGSVSPSRST